LFHIYSNAVGVLAPISTNMQTSAISNRQPSFETGIKTAHYL
jgi:hypothetical protein